MTLATIVSLFFCYVVFHCCGPGVKTLGKAAYEAAFSHPQIEQGKTHSFNIFQLPQVQVSHFVPLKQSQVVYMDNYIFKDTFTIV